MHEQPPVGRVTPSADRPALDWREALLVVDLTVPAGLDRVLD